MIKPEVGAGSSGARAFGVTTHGELVDAAGHLATLTAHGAALVQPYLASVDGYGERALIWIDGELTHAIRKAPRFAGGLEQVTGPFPIADDERAVATAALAPIAADILYARVDVVRDLAGQPQGDGARARRAVALLREGAARARPADRRLAAARNSQSLTPVTPAWRFVVRVGARGRHVCP